MTSACRHHPTWGRTLTYDFVLVHIKGTKNPADGPSRLPDYMENVEIPTGTLIPRSALRMLYPDSHATTTTPLETFPSHIGVHANTTPESSLRSRFIKALEKDPLAQDYRDNPPKPWSWQDDGLLLHDNLVYVPHDDALRVELMQTHHDNPLVSECTPTSGGADKLTSSSTLF